jgi:hypothetical protein
MARLTRMLKRPPREWMLLLSAGSLLLMVRLGLWVLPFDTLRRVLAATAPTGCEMNAADPVCARQVGWAFERMSRYVPAATCLTQALAADWVLKWLGQPTRLRIGASKDAGGSLHAHSWLESGGLIVVGNLPDLGSYTVLTRRKDAQR